MKKTHKTGSSACCGPKPSSHSSVSMTKDNTAHHKLMAMGKAHGGTGKASARA